MTGRQKNTRRTTAASTFTALYNAARLRTDSWNRLRDLARRLRRLPASDPSQEQLVSECADTFAFLRRTEVYHAFPGRQAFEQLRKHFEKGAYEPLARHAVRLVRMMMTGSYRRLDLSVASLHNYADLLNVTALTDAVHEQMLRETRPYFEVLLVDELTPNEQLADQARFLALRRKEDDFIYSVVTVSSFEDALLAAALNFNIQSVLIRSNFPFRSRNRLQFLEELYRILGDDPETLASALASERSMLLGRSLKGLRPELDLFAVTDAPVENIVAELSRDFERAFYQQDDYNDQHLSILKAINERYEAPFFSALRRYSLRPTGAFHALPISHGKSIAKSHWIQEMLDFYGRNIFQAETSATTGGLDSLLQPLGPLKRAQELAARAFGARRTYFVTNGTSTANKIVLQALIRPGDIVLLSHDCHKSHPYAVILAGAAPVYMDAYPLTDCSMYGGVPLAEIKSQLLRLRRAGKLDRVKMLLLTNITFDGIAYDPERVMEEVLAIKPNMIFVWDEAWYAYGRFWPTLRQRTAMEAANRLHERLQSAEYRESYETWKGEFEQQDLDDDQTWIETRLRPDPVRTRVRVYVTHSTHKTLTALRQGSMIHVHDQDFEDAQTAFDEAYMTHTSTSPNYQILASLDMGRRQVELEGYELVHRAMELAMMLRERIQTDPTLFRYFRILGPKDMVPDQYRPSGIDYYYDRKHGWSPLETAWHADEFVLDPTRVTVHVGRTGMDGDTFKKLLMDRFDIQINKTSRNTVLFMINIGVTRGAMAHLVKVLTRIAQELDEMIDGMSSVARRLHEHKVASLTQDLPPLPNFSRFHRAFLSEPDSTTPEGDMRRAFFLAYDDDACRYLSLDGAMRALDDGDELAAATFVTPYPPGFPVLVPGQVVTRDILEYLSELDVKEIHGYEPEFGLRLFTADTLALPPAPAPRRAKAARPARQPEGAGRK